MVDAQGPHAVVRYEWQTIPLGSNRCVRVFGPPRYSPHRPSMQPSMLNPMVQQEGGYVVVANRPDIIGYPLLSCQGPVAPTNVDAKEKAEQRVNHIFANVYDMTQTYSRNEVFNKMETYGRGALYTRAEVDQLIDQAVEKVLGDSDRRILDAIALMEEAMIAMSRRISELEEINTQ